MESLEMYSEQIFGLQELHRSEIEEWNLHHHELKCMKNPGHLKFISVGDFNKTHLPKYYRDDKFMDFIKVCSDLTVRINVGFVSHERPISHPDTDIAYIGRELRGKNANYTGTGFISGIKWIEVSKDNKFCGEIWVITATHVVFDKSEAEKTVCRLFFDRENVKKVLIEGMDVFQSNVNRDVSTLRCVTSDEDLLHRLEARLNSYKHIKDEVYRKFTKPPPSEIITVIISHPHGATKHISVGTSLFSNDMDALNSQLIYNTPTCPGSSGAPVIILGPCGWYSLVVHSGTKGKDRNHSSVGHDFLIKDLCSGPIMFESKSTKDYSPQSALECRNSKYFQGNRQSEGSEADLHKHLKYCKKNPGHTKFIPVDNFTLHHLPEGFRDNDLCELTKSLSDLTVRVDVKMTSPHRPEFWPETKVLYPFYNIRDKTNLRTGSGLIYEVIYYNSPEIRCSCKQCKHSDTASTVFWEFIIFTATHVVFDEIEASHTSLRLFYDREKSPVASVDSVKFIKCGVSEDITLLTVITCNKNLGDKIQMLTRRNKELIDITFQKYFQVDLNVVIMISHPHGCCKQVSVGHVKDEYRVGKFNSKLTYTTCTCPGSSGAIVYLISRKQVHVHSGSINPKLQYCSLGFKL